MIRIVIDQDVWENLQKLGTAFIDTSNDVIRRVLKLDERKLDQRIAQKNNNFHSTKKISQDELIPYIILVLHEHGHKMAKRDVEDEIYKMLSLIFDQPYYHEHVSHVPRWKKSIQWAKERAKGRGLIKTPKDSGRGFWELTTNGENYYFDKFLNMEL